MTEQDKKIMDKIIGILETTPVSDDLYYRLAKRILGEVIHEVKAGYEEVLFEYRRKMNAKNH